ncbi:5935_t:CDS:2, partial [Gigaspora rosea]
IFVRILVWVLALEVALGWSRSTSLVGGLALSELVWFYGTLELSPSLLVSLIPLKSVRLFWGLESDVKETLSKSCSPESPLKLGSLT